MRPINFFRSMVLLVALHLLVTCAPKIHSVSNADAGLDECRTAHELCEEAASFQRLWESMPTEEKRDMASVLNTYGQHCEKAKSECARVKKTSRPER